MIYTFTPVKENATGINIVTVGQKEENNIKRGQK